MHGVTRQAFLRRSMAGVIGCAAVGTGAEAPGAARRRGTQSLGCDVCVIGGGSGGIGAGVAAARAGARTVLVERNQMLGGTSTMAWVHSWEPSVGAGGLPKQLFERMRRDPVGCQQVDYRHGEPRVGGDFISFEPYCLARNALEMLLEAGCTVLPGATLYAADRDGDRLTSVRVVVPDGELTVHARVFVDCSADVVLARAIGCPVRIGEDPAELYGEPHAPAKPTVTLNALTVVYRVRPMPGAQALHAGEDISGAADWGAALRPLPNGDIYVNVVGMMPGTWATVRPRAEVLREGYRRVVAHLRAWQRERDKANWQLVGVAPEVGIRETWRIVPLYTLTEHDLLAGLRSQRHRDIIAVTDHSVDVHGEGHVSYELPNRAYGVPYRSLIPEGMANLLVACRGAGFTHIAASSCRLSRTMMALGEAAGLAAAQAARERKAVPEVDVTRVRSALRAAGAEIDGEDVERLHPNYYGA